MGAFKKYDGSTWQPINPKKLKGIPYTGTLPAVLAGTKAGYLHKYKVYGNLSQSGTPTPENPIYPSECGERTEQLFDVSSITLGKWYAYNGVLEDQVYGAISEMKKINGRQMTIKWHGLKPFSFSIVWFNTNKNYISRSHNIIPSGTDEYTVTAPSSAVYFILQMANGTNPDIPITIEQIASYRTMLNEGSTALPYEPYGYKLPLTSGNTSVDINLGESQTTRRIKKLVLTGEEGWLRTQTRRYYINASTGCPTDYLKQTITTSICSHYQSQNNTASGSNEVKAGHFCFYTGGYELYIGETTISSAADFKTYLQQQYAAGTPVTIWYVLATEETGILNEPLRKIGNYVDTIDSTQTTTQIPTTAGSTTISWAGQGLAPSEFDSVQEWVDIPTYTYTNGEWVADN